MMKFLLNFLFLLACSFSEAQSTSVKKIDSKLTVAFKKMIQADELFRYDSLGPAFIREFKKQLKNPLTFQNKLDSLSKEMAIVSSPDGCLKVYSWDNRSGGTWHDIKVFAQYKTSDDKIEVIQLNSDSSGMIGDYTDSGISKIDTIRIGAKTYYLLLGFGTHGAGMHHAVLRSFRLDGKKLLNDASIFPNGKDIVIECARTDRAELQYDYRTRKIMHKEFILKENGGDFPEYSGKKISLAFKNGKFSK